MGLTPIIPGFCPRLPQSPSFRAGQTHLQNEVCGGCRTAVSLPAGAPTRWVGRAPLTRFRLELHSISQTRLLLRHAHCPSGCIHQPGTRATCRGWPPIMLVGATREKLSPSPRIQLICPCVFPVFEGLQIVSKALLSLVGEKERSIVLPKPPVSLACFFKYPPSLLKIQFFRRRIAP